MSFEYANLTSGEKRKLCLDLLQEFGVRNLRESADELIHSCALPLGLHRNGDAHPSASLNYEKLTFRCLGCGSSGGLLWFMATMRGEDTAQVRQWLDKKTGVGEVQTIDSLLAYIDSVLNPETPAEYVMPRYDRRVLDPWMLVHPWMTDPPSEGGRGISIDNLAKHRVGYGVIRTRLDGNTFIDSERIVIPHFWRGDLVGWQSRRIFKDGTPKYQSTPELPRDRTIYNYDERQPVVLVESPMSVIARTHQAHLEATFGAAVTNAQLRLIERHNEVVLFFDNDSAGWTATKMVGDYLMQRMGNVMVVDNPFNADPADLDDIGFTRLLQRNKVPFVLWHPPKVLEKYTRNEDIVAWTEPPF